MQTTEEKQMSESILTGILLAIAGGAMDAHSYLFRGEVFSNAQTGNVLLFGVHIATGDIPSALRHLWPILAFIAGILVADRIRYSGHMSKLHWRQVSLAVEVALLILVSLMGNALDPIANAMLSLACGIQVESFRKVQKRAAATTMLIGNLRSFTAAMDSYVRTHSAESIEHMVIYSSLIISFVIGAILESLLLSLIGRYAVLLCAVLLSIVFFILYRKPEPTSVAEL